MNIGSIQEERRIYDIVQNFLDGNYSDGYVTAIGRRCEKITLKTDAKEAIRAGKTTELYLFNAY